MSADAPRARRRRRPCRTALVAWGLVSLAAVAVSLITGFRASRAADAPQYLLTKFRVAVDVPAPAEAAEDVAVDAMYADAGLPRATRREWRPMFVLGLLDGALPISALAGAACMTTAWLMARRERRSCGS